MKPERMIEILAEVSQLKTETIESGIKERVNKFPLRYVEALTAMTRAVEEEIRVCERLRAEDAASALSEQNRLRAEIKSLKEELESERIKHAACGVIAMCNTLESLTKNREIKAEYLSASVQDVIRLQEQNIKNQSDLTRLRQCEAIVRELAQTGLITHYMDYIAKARQWVRENPNK